MGSWHQNWKFHGLGQGKPRVYRVQEGQIDESEKTKRLLVIVYKADSNWIAWERFFCCSICGLMVIAKIQVWRLDVACYWLRKQALAESINSNIFILTRQKHSIRTKRNILPSSQLKGCPALLDPKKDFFREFFWKGKNNWAHWTLGYILKLYSKCIKKKFSTRNNKLL